MKFVKGLSILGLAMASQGAWAGQLDADDIYFSATASCAANITPQTVSPQEQAVQAGTESNPFILNASIGSDHELTVTGSATLKVASNCPYKIAIYDTELEEQGTDADSFNSLDVSPSLEELPAVSTTRVKEDSVLVPEVGDGDSHTIYINSKGAPKPGSARGFSYRQMKGAVPVTVVEL